MAGTALAGCGGSSQKRDDDSAKLSAEDADKDLDYTYGEGETSIPMSRLPIYDVSI